jgi:putative ABC transport system permease protein
MTRFPLRIIRAVTPQAHREFVIGDTVERAAEIERVSGERAASRWLWREMWRVMIRAPHHRLSVRPARSSRSARREGLFASSWHDARYALRGFRRTPGITAIMVLTLALGLGATTAIFSVVNAVLLRPLPYATPERVVKIVENIPREESPGGTPRRTSGMNLDELDWWRTNSETLSHIAVSVGEDRTFTTPDGTVQLSGASVSAALFSIRGIMPLLGRVLLPDEERPDAEAVVLSESTWREHFRSDPDVVGRTVQLDSRSYTVVGVMPAEFGTQAFWTPFAVPAPEPGRTRMVQATARLRDGVSLEAASAEANVIGMQLRGMSPPPEGGTSPRFEIVRELDNLTAPVAPALRVLVVAVAAVLLIVCTNVGNLLLVRGTRRQHEIAIRRALGATRARIARQVLTESLALALFASLLGAILAYGGVEVLRAVAATKGGGRFAAAQTLLPRLEEISIDPVVMFFVCALSIATPLLFGVLPALRLSRFGEQGHGSGAQLSASSSVTRIGHVLGTAQVAFAMTLLVGAGLLLHSFLKLASVDPGVDLRGVLSFDVAIPGDYTATRRLQVVEEIVTRLQANPLVTSAGFSNLPPLVPRASIFLSSFVPEGMTREEINADWNEQGPPETRIVSSGYLRALGARLVTGRWLDDQETTAPAMAALVSRPFAQHFLRDREPVGTIMQSRFGPVTVVGVVDDLHLGGLDAEPQRAVFLEARQVLAAERPETADEMFLRTGGDRVPFAARTTTDPLALVADVRGIVRGVDPALVLDGVSPMAQVLSNLTARPRFYAVLLGVFGAIAAFIAVIGIYGVLAYLVGQRTQEIGIRMALGAQQANVLRFVLGRGVAMIAIGIAAGIVGALGLTRYLEGMLYGITALDGTTYVVVGAAFAAVALFASYVPARRATRIDPLAALRHD